VHEDVGGGLRVGYFASDWAYETATINGHRQQLQIGVPQNIFRPNADHVSQYFVFGNPGVFCTGGL